MHPVLPYAPLPLTLELYNRAEPPGAIMQILRLELNATRERILEARARAVLELEVLGTSHRGIVWRGTGKICEDQSGLGRPLPWYELGTEILA